MKTVRLVIGSAVQVHIHLSLQEYSFLLQAGFTAIAGVPAVEVVTVITGRLSLIVLPPTASSSTMALSAWVTTTVRVGILFVASRNNKSLRSGLALIA